MAVQLDVAHAIVLAPGEGETITDRADRTIRILLAHEFLDMTWTRCMPGHCSAEPHVHDRHADAFYVLAGEITFVLGPELTEVRAPRGTFAAAPPGLTHGFRNEGPGEAIYLNFHAPSTGFADFLRGRGPFDSHEPVGAGRPFADGVVLHAGEGERVESDERVRWIKADLTEISVAELTVQPGWAVDLHHHDDHLDSLYVLDGEIELHTACGPVRGGAGTFTAAPPGAVHGVRALTAARLLIVHAAGCGLVARNS